jgi:hypothetical protein
VICFAVSLPAQSAQELWPGQPFRKWCPLRGVAGDIQDALPEQAWMPGLTLAR